MTAVLAPPLLRYPAGTVGASMITDVKLCPAGATVRELRTFFADEHVHSAVVVDAGVLLAVVDRSDLPSCAGADLPVAALGSLGNRVVGPQLELDRARRVLLASGRRRLGVVDPDGMLLGLLCLKRNRTGFCSDRDVRDRSCDR